MAQVPPPPHADGKNTLLQIFVMLVLNSQQKLDTDLVNIVDLVEKNYLIFFCFHTTLPHLSKEDKMSSDTVKKTQTADLKSTFPEMKGFSHRNLKYMVRFAKAKIK